MNKYLFICAVSNSGSELLYKTISDCQKAVPLTKIDSDNPTEMQHLSHCFEYMPTVHTVGHPHLMPGLKPHPYNDPNKYNWNKIKQRLWQSWKSHPKYTEESILVEKSTTNPFRANILWQEFGSEAYFIFMCRNPYALSEGIHRRKGADVKDAAKHAGETLKWNSYNLVSMLADKDQCWKCLNTTYEEVCDQPENFRDKLVSILPELSDWNQYSELELKSVREWTHGSTQKLPFHNFNEEQIKRLTPQQVDDITAILTDYSKEMIFWGYKYL